MVSFVVSLFVARRGFIEYAKRQGLALLIMAAVIFAAGGLGWATADHPPLIDDKGLALDIEVRVPAKGRSIEDLKPQDFSVALVVSASNRNYSDMRWAEAQQADEFITVGAWAPLNSRNANRQITAGTRDESRQVFNVILRHARKAPRIIHAFSRAHERERRRAPRSPGGVNAVANGCCQRVWKCTTREIRRRSTAYSLDQSRPGEAAGRRWRLLRQTETPQEVGKARI